MKWLKPSLRSRTSGPNAKLPRLPLCEISATLPGAIAFGATPENDAAPERTLMMPKQFGPQIAMPLSATARTRSRAGVEPAAFAEARRQHDRGGNAVRLPRFQHAAGGLGGDRDHEAVHLLRQLGDAREALVAEHVRIARIDREDAALEAGVAQVRDHPRARPRARRCADHRDRLGIEQRPHRSSSN